MKQLPQSLSMVLFLTVASCNNPQVDTPSGNTQTSSSAPLKISMDDSPVISAEPSENVTLDDYREEAVSIKTEAYQIIQRAKASRCSEASGYASRAIELCKLAESTNVLNVAEKTIGQASDALIHSEDALLFCEDKSENAYSFEAQNSVKK